MEKFVENIFHGVSSIFPHTYIHFPSTSPLRYIARIESMSVTRNLHFPGKYTGERGDRRMVDALRGWKRAKGGTFLRFILSFSPLDYWNERLAGDERVRGKFRAQLFNRPYWPEWFSWEDEQLISYDLSRFRDFDGRIVDLGTIHYVFWVIFCAWQIRRNQIRVDRSG